MGNSVFYAVEFLLAGRSFNLRSIKMRIVTLEYSHPNLYTFVAPALQSGQNADTQTTFY
jgi:hypothetical protein